MIGVLTGVAPHSLGEALVLSDADASKRFICFDIVANHWLQSQAAAHLYRQQDLNPFSHAEGLIGFRAEITQKLDGALKEIGTPPIDWLVQSAGVYWSGPLAETPVNQVSNLLGVNIVGRVEVLQTILKRDIAASGLTYVDIGSFQGLNVRAGRSIYSATKGFGIDFSSSLMQGNELLRSLYFAPGPIDTHMLHHNHWVVKAGLPQSLLSAIHSGDRDVYRLILVDCSTSALGQFLEERKIPENTVMGGFARYRVEREKAKQSSEGILSPELCASKLKDMITTPSRYPSGVYLARSRSDLEVELNYRPFNQLNRIRYFS